MVGQLVERLFGGDPTELVHHLVREGEVDAATLDALRREITAREEQRDERAKE